MSEGTDVEIPFFSSGETYRRDIRRRVGEKERVEWVELRPLQAGDRADLQDAVRISIAQDDDGDDEGGQTELRMGTMRVLTVARAVVNWSLPVSPSVNTVRALHPEVFQQIYNEVSWGDVPPEPSEQEAKGDPLPVSVDSSSSAELAPTDDAI